MNKHLSLVINSEDIEYITYLLARLKVLNILNNTNLNSWARLKVLSSFSLYLNVALFKLTCTDLNDSISNNFRLVKFKEMSITKYGCM